MGTGYGRFNIHHHSTNHIKGTNNDNHHQHTSVSRSHNALKQKNATLANKRGVLP
jgi:hypothetical protein